MICFHRYGQDVAISEDTAETIRRHTEKKYGELREGETMSGMHVILSFERLALYVQ